MTNGDRIRTMSDEELAYTISEIASRCERNTECHQSCYGCDEYFCEQLDCLNWLKQEVGE